MTVIWTVIAVALVFAGVFALMIAMAFVPDYLTARRDPLLRRRAETAALAGCTCAVVGFGLLALAVEALPL